jgi:hypothetical protein
MRAEHGVVVAGFGIALVAGELQLGGAAGLVPRFAERVVAVLFGHTAAGVR